jgi:hypothetical protein
MNGGACGHPHAWAFACDCTGTGYGWDICQTPGGEPAAELVSDCLGDINGDLRINVADILAILTAFGQSVEPGDANAAADCMPNGVVDVADVLQVLGWFGATCNADGVQVNGR